MDSGFQSLPKRISQDSPAFLGVKHIKTTTRQLQIGVPQFLPGNYEMANTSIPMSKTISEVVVEPIEKIPSSNWIISPVFRAKVQTWITPRKFNSSTLKIGRAPKGKDRLPIIIFYRGELLNFEGVPPLKWRQNPTRNNCVLFLTHRIHGTIVDLPLFDFYGKCI